MILSTTMEEATCYEPLGLTQNPFPVAPDEENFYLSPRIDQVLTNLVHGILTRKGFMILTGDIGLGKTTISRRLIRILEKKGVETSLVFHTRYKDVELLKEINRDFGLETDSLLFGDQMKRLNGFLLEKNHAQKNCAIIIDDAQNLDHDSLELIRMISNLETDRQKLVQILLIGQPELCDTLASPQLRQLESRVVIKEQVGPLSRAELKNYLQFKLNASGGDGTDISPSAIKALFGFTRGNFRKINMVMDRCLYVAFIHSSRRLTGDIVRQAIADLDPNWPHRRRRYLLGAALAVGLGGILTAGAFFGIGPSSRKADRMPAAAVTESSLAATPAGQRPATVAPPAGAVADEAVSPAVRDFLSAYQLTAYADDFQRALTTRRFEDFSDALRKETGYELVRLTQLPARIRTQYGVLTVPPGDAGSAPMHLMFWRPPFAIDQFYYAYQGEEIRRLQEMLASLQYYRDRIDGIVGKNLMASILAFQRRMQLPVTGVPDRQTFFLIVHLFRG